MTRRLVALLALSPLFIFLMLADVAFAQKDTIVLKPVANLGTCCWEVSIKNRNVAGSSIDELQLSVTALDGTSIIDFSAAPGSQWTTNVVGNLDANATANVSGIPAGGTKLIGTLCLDIPPSSLDKIVTMSWKTKSGVNDINTGTLDVVCTPTQGNTQDSFSVAPSLSGNDPCFNFTVYKKNSVGNVHRFIAKLITVGGGTMRPSKITPPNGWSLDSVNAFGAYFTAQFSNDLSDGSVSGFNVCLRGNPSISKFDFAVSTLDPQNIEISRDTLRNIPITFTGTTADADIAIAGLQSGCLYSMTVKNYHASNTALPSRIRKVVLWSKTSGVTFTAAPSAPTFWVKTVKTDSIIYTAPADSAGIAGGIVETSFKYSVDGPTTTPFKIGWKTYRTLVDELTTGEFTQQCQKEAPKQDTATLESPQNCCYLLKYSNLHNSPPSDLKAIQFSIPNGSGKLTNAVNSSGWNNTNPTDVTVRFVAPNGSSQTTGATNDALFCIEPTTPGQNITLTWSTYDDAALSSGTPVATGTHTLNCSPIVSKCDVVSFTSVPSDTCTFNYSFQNLRTENINHVSFEMQGGWKIDTAIAPAGWTVQLQNARSLAEYNSTGTTGVIKPNESLNGFILGYSALDKLDTFHVNIKRFDAALKECSDVVEHVCVSSKSSGVESFVTKSSVSVYPNPVTRDGVLELTVERQSRVHVTLLDVLGHEVAVVSNSILTQGSHSFPFSMKSLSPGSYYLRIQTLSGVITQKVVLVP